MVPTVHRRMGHLAADKIPDILLAEWVDIHPAESVDRLLRDRSQGLSPGLGGSPEPQGWLQAPSQALAGSR